MRVKVSELIGKPLDWAVCKALHPLDKLNTTHRMVREGRSRTGWFIIDQASTDWVYGGPILEREKIELIPLWLNDSFEGYAASHRLSVKYDKEGEFVQGSDCKQYGQTPLIAAMRCFCHSKLGDFVDIPEDLKNDTQLHTQSQSRSMGSSH